MRRASAYFIEIVSLIALHPIGMIDMVRGKGFTAVMKDKRIRCDGQLKPGQPGSHAKIFILKIAQPKTFIHSPIVSSTKRLTRTEKKISRSGT